MVVVLLLVVAAPRTPTNWHELRRAREDGAHNRQSDNPNDRKRERRERERSFTGLGAS